MNQTAAKKKMPCCYKCGSSEYFNELWLEKDVYFCQQKFGYCDYCLGMSALCKHCDRIYPSDEFIIDKNQKVRHKTCGEICDGLTFRLQAEIIMTRNTAQGYLPYGVTDIRDFVYKNDLHIPGIRS